MHRLMSRRRKVDNRQAPMPEGNSASGIDPDTLVFRPAMAQTGGHAPNGDSEFFVPFVLPRVQKSCYATHKSCLPIAVCRWNGSPPMAGSLEIKRPPAAVLPWRVSALA